MIVSFDTIIVIIKPPHGLSECGQTVDASASKCRVEGAGGSERLLLSARKSVRTMRTRGAGMLKPELKEEVSHSQKLP